MKIRDIVARLRALDQDATATIAGLDCLIIEGPARPPNGPRHYDINPMLVDAIATERG